MNSLIDTQAALEHFRQHDVVMARLLEVGLQGAAPIAIPTPKPSSQYFASIVSSIISQQISTKAADSIHGRVKALLGRVTPQRVQEVTDEELRACGLSGQKVKYIRHNAAIWHEIPVGNFVHLSDEEIIAELTKLYGIGRWTAEMFLMFSMARPNVFSYSDLGLMQSFFEQYPLKPHFKKKIPATVDIWAPHKTLASLALWWHKDGGPVLL